MKNEGEMGLVDAVWKITKHGLILAIICRDLIKFQYFWIIPVLFDRNVQIMNNISEGQLKTHKI